MLHCKEIDLRHPKLSHVMFAMKRPKYRGFSFTFAELFGINDKQSVLDLLPLLSTNPIPSIGFFMQFNSLGLSILCPQLKDLPNNRIMEISQMFLPDHLDEFIIRLKKRLENSIEIKYYIGVLQSEEEALELAGYIRKQIREIKIQLIALNKKQNEFQYLSYVVKLALKNKCIYIPIAQPYYQLIKSHKKVNEFSQLKKDIWNKIKNVDNFLVVNTIIHGRPCVIIPISKEKIQIPDEKEIKKLYQILGVEYLIKQTGDIDKILDFFLSFLSDKFIYSSI